MAKKLFIGSLSWDTTDDQLKELFSTVGAVVSATVIIDRETGKSKGFGFVEMSSEQEAQAAIQGLNGKFLDNREIVVTEARPKAPRDNRSGNNFFSGRGGGGRHSSNRRGGSRRGYGGKRDGRY